MSKLKQTKGYANFKGIISGLHNRKKGSSKTEAGWGTKLQFFVKTSEFNSIPIELVQYNSQVGKPVYLSTKAEDGNFETKEIDWDKRHEKFDGWQIIGTSLRAKDKEDVVNLVAIDAIEYIEDNFNDGDEVFISCEIKRSESGDKKYINYELKRMYTLTDPLDFTTEDFEETSEFKETFVYNEMFTDKKTKKSFVNGNVILYDGKVVPAVYTIDLEMEEDKVLSEYIEKNCNFGDVLTVEGVVHNRVEGEWIENDTSKGVIGRTSRSFQKPEKTFITHGERKEFQIIGIADIKKGLYSREEFEQDADDDTPEWLK